jgi:hypothetical protein
VSSHENKICLFQLTKAGRQVNADPSGRAINGLVQKHSIPDSGPISLRKLWHDTNSKPEILSRCAHRLFGGCERRAIRACAACGRLDQLFVFTLMELSFHFRHRGSHFSDGLSLERKPQSTIFYFPDGGPNEH